LPLTVTVPPFRNVVALFTVGWMHGLAKLARLSSAARSCPARQPIAPCDVELEQLVALKTASACANVATV